MTQSSNRSVNIAHKFGNHIFSMRANTSTYMMYSQKIIDFYSQREHGTNYNYPVDVSVTSDAMAS